MSKLDKVKTIKCSTGGIDCKPMYAGDLKPELLNNRNFEMLKAIPTFNFQLKIFANLLHSHEEMDKFVVSYLKENRNDINALLTRDIKINNVLNSAFNEHLNKIDLQDTQDYENSMKNRK